MTLLGGLLVWAAHFFLLYAISSVFPGTSLARSLSLAVTVPALGADIAILWMTVGRRLLYGEDPLGRWISDFGAAGAGLSIVAVLWQALPTVLV